MPANPSSISEKVDGSGITDSVLIDWRKSSNDEPPATLMDSARTNANGAVLVEFEITDGLPEFGSEHFPPGEDAAPVSESMHDQFMTIPAAAVLAGLLDIVLPHWVFVRSFHILKPKLP
jgi:hypothetical protein